MHGDLQVRAPSGGGCCFVATLPVAPGADQVLEVLQAPEADLATSRSQVIPLTPRRGSRTHHRPTGRDDNFPYRVKKSG